MRKLLLIQSFVALAVSTFSPLTSVAEKVVIERPEGSEIKSIEINDDILIIKSKNKTHKFKLTELINSEDKVAKVEEKKKVPKTLNEAFDINGQWYVFGGQDAGSNSLKPLNKFAKKPFKGGEFLLRVLFKGKYYARDLRGEIYEPHWETGKDFSVYLIPIDKFIESLKKEIRITEESIDKLAPQVANAQKDLEAKREKYIAFLIRNNIKTTMVDKNGNIIKSESSGDYSSKIKSALRSYNRQIKRLEDLVESSIYEWEALQSSLPRLKERLLKTQMFISKYADNNSK